LIPPGWEPTPGLLKRFTITGSVYRKKQVVDQEQLNVGGRIQSVRPNLTQKLYSKYRVLLPCAYSGSEFFSVLVPDDKKCGVFCQKTGLDFRPYWSGDIRLGPDLPKCKLQVRFLIS
jgi:hypothetical protein